MQAGLSSQTGPGNWQHSLLAPPAAGSPAREPALNNRTLERIPEQEQQLASWGLPGTSLPNSDGASNAYADSGSHSAGARGRAATASAPHPDAPRVAPTTAADGPPATSGRASHAGGTAQQRPQLASAHSAQNGASGDSSTGRTGRRIRISQLGTMTSLAEIRLMCEMYGNVQNVDLRRDAATEDAVALVDFAAAQHAGRAQQKLNNSLVMPGSRCRLEVVLQEVD